MNAIPPKGMGGDTAGKRNRASASEGVRLTMDFDTPDEQADPIVGDPLAEAPAANPEHWPGDAASGATAQAFPRGAARAPQPGMPPQLAGIEVTLSVEVGSHRLPLRELLAVEPGQIFQLDRMTAEPVSVLVNGKPFALGEVVAIGERFGIRLIDIPGSEPGR